MKVCSRCKVPRDESEFSIDERYKNGFRSVCKICRNKRVREIYKNNPRKLIEKAIKTHKKYFQQWMDLIIIPQGLNKCSHCGYDKCFNAIDFHHRNPKEKKFGIGIILRKPITSERLEELAKTDPLCSNCHREKEAGLW